MQLYSMPLGRFPSPFAPVPRKVNLAQAWVNVNPDVNVQAPISIELGSLPLSVGLFAASGLAFLARTSLPDGAGQTIATVAGAGLALGGVINLLMPKIKAATPSKTPAGVPGPVGPDGPLQSQGYQRPETTAFEAIEGRIISPADFTTVDIYPWASSYPVRVQLRNPANQAVTFSLELAADEYANGTADQSKLVQSSLPVTMSLGPLETRDVDLSMPISSWDALTDFVDITLYARKRRAPGEGAVMIDSRSFVIE